MEYQIMLRKICFPYRPKKNEIDEIKAEENNIEEMNANVRGKK